MVPNGAGLGVLDGGGIYARMHYTIDPSKKDAEWIAQGKKTQGLKWWMQQMEMKEDVYDGEPIFPSPPFMERHHVPAYYRENLMPTVPGSEYLGCWDCGMTHQPAFALAQITPFKQVQWMLEVLPERPMAMSLFAPIVRQALINFLPFQRGLIIHFGDPTGGTKSGSEGHSAFEIARGHGFHIRPAEQNPTYREDAVVWGLEDWIVQEGPEETWVPRVLYCEKGCPVLVAGMKGAYCRQLQATSPTIGPGMRAKPKPLKNWFSHVNDAHQYGMVECKRGLFEVRQQPKRFLQI